MKAATEDVLSCKKMDANEDENCAEIIYPDGKRLLFHQAVEISFLKTLGLLCCNYHLERIPAQPIYKIKDLLQKGH